MAGTGCRGALGFAVRRAGRARLVNWHVNRSGMERGLGDSLQSGGRRSSGSDPGRFGSETPRYGKRFVIGAGHGIGFERVLAMEFLLEMTPCSESRTSALETRNAQNLRKVFAFDPPM